MSTKGVVERVLESQPTLKASFEVNDVEMILQIYQSILMK